MPRHFAIGDFELRADERRLLRRGEPQQLGARAFDLLLALIEHRDRVVGKDELLTLVWPGVVVEENTLTVQVSNLRKVLGPMRLPRWLGAGISALGPEAARRHRDEGRAMSLDAAFAVAPQPPIASICSRSCVVCWFQ